MFIFLNSSWSFILGYFSVKSFKNSAEAFKNTLSTSSTFFTVIPISFSIYLIIPYLLLGISLTLTSFIGFLISSTIGTIQLLQFGCKGGKFTPA